MAIRDANATVPLSVPSRPTAIRSKQAHRYPFQAGPPLSVPSRPIQRTDCSASSPNPGLVAPLASGAKAIVHSRADRARPARAKCRQRDRARRGGRRMKAIARTAPARALEIGRTRKQPRPGSRMSRASRASDRPPTRPNPKKRSPAAQILQGIVARLDPREGGSRRDPDRTLAKRRRGPLQQPLDATGQRLLEGISLASTKLPAVLAFVNSGIRGHTGRVSSSARRRALVGSVKMLTDEQIMGRLMLLNLAERRSLLRSVRSGRDFCHWDCS